MKKREALFLLAQLSVSVAVLGLVTLPSISTSSTSSSTTQVTLATSMVSTSVGADAALVTNSSDELGLSVHVLLNSDGNYTFTVEESNLLNSVNNVTTADGWNYSKDSLSPCGPNGATPIELAVLQGRYGIDNYTSAQALPLYNTGVVYLCGRVLYTLPAYYSFQPLSDDWAIYSGSAPPDRGSSIASSTDGYWTGAAESPTNPGSAAFNLFSPGVYTLVGEDEWGSVALLQFTVG